MAAYIQDAIMCFGDSITEGAWEDGGFGRRLAHDYSRKLDVFNRGLGGYNTEWAIPVFEQYFAKQHEQHHVPKVCLLIIWFGANDACIEPSPQHVPLPKYLDNLRHIVNLVRSPESPYYSVDTKIILINAPPINTYQRGAELMSRDPPVKLDRLFETTKSYADAVVTLGAVEKIPVVDVWTALWKAAGEDEASLSKFSYDGLHLNADGYSIMYDTLLDCIEQHMPELHFDRLRYVFAGWAEIDRADPRSSLVKREIEIK